MPINAQIKKIKADTKALEINILLGLKGVIDDETIINAFNDIKEFAKSNDLKIGKIEYWFNTDTYEKKYFITCEHPYNADISYYNKKNKFCNKLRNKYNLDQVYFEEGFIDESEPYVTVCCSKRFTRFTYK